MEEKRIRDALEGDFRPGREVPSQEFRANLPDELRAMLEKREARGLGLGRRRVA
ncbi:MAG TPA: hypothetical protein VJP88_00280 [Caulobacteraceae bacterium]|nr:hypothetical protein [Caulobacteraceae bacterium]